MSLPKEPVFSKLQSEFVVGWQNIIKKDYVGESFGYTCDQSSVGTTNGAGPHNVQIFVLAPDLTVLHALPGFWHPADLAQELQFAQKLQTVWNDANLSREQKNAKFTAMQLAEYKNHSRATTARSGWQGFDAANEKKRITAGKKRDTMLSPMAVAAQQTRGRRGKSRPRMKPINQLVHERMAQRPFVPFARFDTAEFADYGRVFYDNNRRHDGKGKVFMTPRKVAKAKAKEDRLLQARARRAEAHAKRRARAAEQRAKRAEQRRASHKKRLKKKTEKKKSKKKIV